MHRATYRYFVWMVILIIHFSFLDSPSISRSIKVDESSGCGCEDWYLFMCSSLNAITLPHMPHVHAYLSTSHSMLRYAQQLSHRGSSWPCFPILGDWPVSSNAAKGETVAPHGIPHASCASVSAGHFPTVLLTAIATPTLLPSPECFQLRRKQNNQNSPSQIVNPLLWSSPNPGGVDRRTLLGFINSPVVGTFVEQSR